MQLAVNPILAVLLSPFTGFGIAISTSSLLVKMFVIHNLCYQVHFKLKAKGAIVRENNREVELLAVFTYIVLTLKNLYKGIYLVIPSSSTLEPTELLKD